MPKSSKSQISKKHVSEYYGYDEDAGFLDTPEFRRYCSKVQRIIESLAKRGIFASYGDMKRALGDGFEPIYHADALEMLEGAGSIGLVKFVSPLRYKPKTMPEREQSNYGYNNRSMPASRLVKTENL